MTILRDPDSLHANARILPPVATDGATSKKREFILLNGGKTNVPPIHSAAELQHREFPPIKYVVPGIIAPGLTLFAGKPKIGKSWFCLDIALCVAGERAIALVTSSARREMSSTWLLKTITAVFRSAFASFYPMSAHGLPSFATLRSGREQMMVVSTGSTIGA